MSRLVAIIVASTLVSACQSAPPADAWVYRQTAEDKASIELWQAMEERWLGVDSPDDPVDVLYWRAVACGFAVSEIGGDATQDAAIEAGMRGLRCDHQIEDARTLRGAHLNDARMVARIDAFIQFRK